MSWVGTLYPAAQRDIHLLMEEGSYSEEGKADLAPCTTGMKRLKMVVALVAAFVVGAYVDYKVVLM